MPPLVTRRAVLSATGSAALVSAAGCARRLASSRPAGAVLRSSSAVAAPASDALAMTVNVAGVTAQTVAAFQAYDPDVRVLLPGSAASRAAKPAPLWGVVFADQDYAGPDPADLGPALRHGNFDATAVLPGAMDLFLQGGVQYGLPTTLQPQALHYQKAAFAGAGLPEPTIDWTLDDFVQACNAIQAAVREGALPGLYGPLPPMLGSSQVTGAFFGASKPQTVTFRGDLLDNNLLAAFAAGFGGWLLRDGRADFTNPGALAGLQRLLQIAVQFGASAEQLPQSANETTTYRRGAAMYFTTAVAETAGAGVGYVRLPLMPAGPVVPATLNGVKLGWFGPQPGGGGSHNPPDAALEAVVKYALWQYQLVRQNPAANLPPPVVADPTTQSRYWSAPLRVNAGESAVADGRGFIFPLQGWPPGIFPEQALFAALTAAATGQDLRAALASAEQQVNAQIAQGRG